MKIVLRGVLSLFASLCLQVCFCFAASPSRDAVREKALTDELQKNHPEWVATFQEATEAFDKADYPTATQLFQKVVDGAPDFDAALRRLGTSLVYTGHRAEGLKACKQAIALKRSSANLFTLATNLALGPKENSRATPDDLRDALRLLGEARGLPDGAEVDNYALSAQIALELDADAEFRSFTADLRNKFPNTLPAHYFGAFVELKDERWIRAERELAAAERKGLPHDVVQKILDSGVHSRALAWEIGLTCAGLVAFWLIGLGTLFCTGFILSKLTLRSAQRADPNTALSSSEQTLRKIYRVVLNTAGLYYYISLPIVLLIVIAVSGGILFAFLAGGWIPIKLTIILIIGVIATIFTMIKSLFLKTDKTEAGRPLKREEAPGLWQLAEEVAAEVGTRTVDEIRITPGTDLAVYERGNWREKMRNDAHRILLLGTGVLNGFKQDHFRSVLAHEYGHFSHRDTAGGEVALRVRVDMLKFYYAMRQAGQATHINLAFQFLRAYNFIFRRISHGATRLQEILADRVAAQNYGASAFEGGLKHVIRRSIEFGHFANLEIKEALSTQQPLQRIYETVPSDATSVETEYSKAISRATSDDDTHPSPTDRFKYVATVRAKSEEQKDGLVWDLFVSREEITKEMLTRIEEQIAPYRKKS